MIFYDVLPWLGVDLTAAERRGLVLFAYAWLALAMLVAYLGKVVEPRRFGRPLSVLSSTWRAMGRCSARARSPPTSRSCAAPR